MPVGNGEARRLRQVAGLNREELADICELNARTISRFETGGDVNASTVETIAIGLAKHLGKTVNPDHLLVDESKRAAPIAERRRPTVLMTAKSRALLEKLINQDDVRAPSSFFVEFLKRKIENQALTRSELTERLGVSSGSLQGWLSGATIPNWNAISRILEVIDLNDEDIAGLQAALEQSLPSHRSSKNEGKKVNRLWETAGSIPDQSPLIRFGVSKNTKLNLIPTLADENDHDTIVALRSELLAAQGPVEHLKERYAKKPNVPQAGLFGPLTTKYHEELSKDPKEINYTVLFARGSRFYAARRRAAQQIASHEWPELDADENEAIDAICDLHGPMIMASAAGRKLVEDAHRYEVPPDVYEEDQKTIEEFGQVIAEESDLIEPETSEAYRELTAKIEGDPQPARSRGLGIAATGSALTAIVGGAAWYGAGGAVATLIVPAAAIGATGFVSGFFWEAIKTMPRFKNATSSVGNQFEKTLEKAEKHADDKERALLKGMADLVERKRSLFEKAASLRPEFGWAKKFLNSDRYAEELPASEERSLIVFSAQSTQIRKISQQVASEIGAEFHELETIFLHSTEEILSEKKSIELISSLIRETRCVISLSSHFSDYGDFLDFAFDNTTVVFLSQFTGASHIDETNERIRIALSAKSESFLSIQLLPGADLKAIVPGIVEIAQRNKQ